MASYSSISSSPASPLEAGAVDGEGPQNTHILTKRDKSHAKSEMKKQRQAANKPASLSLTGNSPPAGPSEAGAVGGKGSLSQSSDSRFEATAKEADEDFSDKSHQSQPSEQTTNNTTPKPQSFKKPYERYFQCGLFPRFLVVKHQDPAKNIVTENSFIIGKGLKEVVSNKHFSRIKIIRHFRSCLLLIEVDERLTAERLLNTRRLLNIPVKVEVHQTKNSCKGVIFNDYHDMTDEEIRDELSPQLVTHVHRVVRMNGTKTNTVFLTFAAERPPAYIDIEGFHSVKVTPYQQRPRQCNTCLGFGHGPKFCKEQKLCHRCSLAADHNPDACPNPTRCINCEGAHSAFSKKDCPYYVVEEAVLAQKESARSDIESAREYVIRTHSLIDQIPKLKSRKDKLPPLLAQVVANTGHTAAEQRGRPQQPGRPVNPPQQQPPTQPQPNHEDLLSKMDSMMKKNLEPLSSIPDRLDSLSESLTKELAAAKETISTLEKNLDGMKEVVNLMLNIPLIRQQYEKALIEGRIRAQEGLPPIGAGSSSVPDALDAERKSRSLSRGKAASHRSKTPARRSNTPIRTSSRAPMEHQPSTPSHGTKRKEMSSEQSPSSSSGENKGADSSPAEDPGSGTKSAAETPVKKVNRALSISPVPKAPHSPVTLETSMPEVEAKDPLDLSFTRGVDLSSQITPLPSSVPQQELVMNPGSLETES